VTASGHVWLLDQTEGGGYVVFGFDSTGRMSSRIPLDTPSGMFENWFKVADDGIILVAGYYADVAPKETQGKPYLALFDQNGTVRKTLGSDDLDRVDLTAASKGPVEGDVASGPDGNFYILQRNDILVISEWGDIVRRVKFVRPENDVLAQRLELADGFLSLSFDKIDKDRSVHTEFLVLHSANGAAFALYKPSAELAKSIPRCFRGRAGYLFSAGQNGRIKLLSASLR
jgi:hypothetical protein